MDFDRVNQSQINSVMGNHTPPRPLQTYVAMALLIIVIQEQDHSQNTFPSEIIKHFTKTMNHYSQSTSGGSQA